MIAGDFLGEPAHVGCGLAHGQHLRVLQRDDCREQEVVLDLRVRADVLVEREERLAEPGQRVGGQTWRGDGLGEREPDRVEPFLSGAAVSFSDVGD